MGNRVAHSVSIADACTAHLERPWAAALTEPFSAGLAAAGRLYYFGLLTSLFRPEAAELPMLDVGAGSGWLAELLARMGRQVVALDAGVDLPAHLQGRAGADRRIDPALLSFARGDGRAMPFDGATFGHVLCYDALHRMADHPKVLAEFHRVLHPGGRAICIEPGAHPARPPGENAFAPARGTLDAERGQRGIVVEEVDELARRAGFRRGLSIVPMPHPADLQGYGLADWARFRAGDRLLRARFADRLAEVNTRERVIFFADRPR